MKRLLLLAGFAAFVYNTSSAQLLAGNGDADMLRSMPTVPLERPVLNVSTQIHGAVLSLRPPAESGDKARADEMVYWGNYFLCFTSDSVYNSLQKMDYLWTDNASSEDRKLEFAVRPEGRTNDLERVFNEDQVAFLDSMIQRFEPVWGRVALITLDSSWVSTGDFERVATELHQSWQREAAAQRPRLTVAICAATKRLLILNAEGGKKITPYSMKYISEQIMMPGFRNRDYFNATAEGLRIMLSLLK